MVLSRSTLSPYTTLFRSANVGPGAQRRRPAPKHSEHSFYLSLVVHALRVQHSIPHIHQSICHFIRCIAKRRSEEHTSELKSPCNLVCRLLLVKKKINNKI